MRGTTVSTATASSHTEHKLSVCGRSIRYLKGGSGPTVITLHHSTGSIGWLPVHEALAANHTVLVPDMPGYGQSERPEWARDPRDLAIMLGMWMEGLGLTGVTLVGFGFGGFVAAEMATMDRSRLRALVLVGAAGLQPRTGEIMDEMLLDFTDYMKDGFRDEAHFTRAFGTEVEASIKELWDFSREMSARVSWKPYMFSRRLPQLLTGVSTPALIIWGSEDRVIPPVCGQQYKEALPNAKLEVIAGAGHYVEYEEPDRVASLIAGAARA